MSIIKLIEFAIIPLCLGENLSIFSIKQEGLFLWQKKNSVRLNTEIKQLSKR